MAEKKKWEGTTVKNTPQLKWTEAQLAKASAIAESNGLTLPEFMAIIAHESAGTFNPSVVNSVGATGIIQFMPTTAASLLLKEQRAAAINSAPTPEAKKEARKKNKLFEELTPAQQSKAKVWAQESVAKLSLDRQLDLTSLYLADATRGKKGLDAVYSAVFVGNPNTSVIPGGTKAYSNNASLDKNNDNKITRNEWMDGVKSKITLANDYLKEVQASDGLEEIRPDPATARRAQMILEAAAPTGQIPAQLPEFSKARELTLAEILMEKNKEYKPVQPVNLMDVLNKPPETKPQPLQLQSVQASPSFAPNILTAANEPEEEDELTLASLYG